MRHGSQIHRKYMINQQDFRFRRLKKRGGGVGVIQPANNRQTGRAVQDIMTAQVGWHTAEAPTKRDNKTSSDRAALGTRFTTLTLF